MDNSFMSPELAERVKALQTFLPADSPMQLHVMELALAVQHRTAEVTRLRATLDRAIEALGSLPEDTLGWSTNPGGGLTSNLYGLVAELAQGSRELRR